MTAADLVPGWSAAKRLAFALAVLVVGGLVMGLVVFGLVRLWPRHDPTPVAVARHDEKVAARAAATIGDQTERANSNAKITIDLVKKDIRDAFDAIPPAPAPVAGAPARELPAAPVDRVRDRLNESIARANRAAGTADPTD